MVNLDIEYSAFCGTTLTEFDIFLTSAGAPPNLPKLKAQKGSPMSDVKAYLYDYVLEYNKTAVSYKKIKVLKVRNEDFPKNTLRKIMRFKIDTTID